MPAYAKGRLAWGLCQRCGLRYLLRELVLDGYYPNIRVCTGCYDPPQPQERLAVVSDPVALWKPAVDTYLVPPPFLTATVVGGQVVLNWTSIMAPAVGNDVGGRHHGPYLSAGYEVWRAPGQNVAALYASLLLHMDGANGSALFPDSSVNNFPVTVNTSDTPGDGAVVDTSAPKFGTGAMNMNPQLTFEFDYCSVPAIANGPLDLTHTNFTIEFWIKANIDTAGVGRWVIGDLSSVYNWGIEWTPSAPNGASFSLFARNSVTVYSAFGPATTLIVGTWVAVACVKQGTTLTVYVNGVAGTPQIMTTGGPTLVAGSGTVAIGGNPGVGSCFPGELDDLRITRAALYSGNYTPSAVALSATVIASEVANQFSLLQTFLNTPDEFGALAVETLTYTDPTPLAPTSIYYIRGYDTHENAQNG